jgi:hypothetical protein
MIKYRIRVMESERGWGREYWTEDFDSYQEAKDRIGAINSRNTSLTAPDWYMQAEEAVEAVEVTEEV